MKKIICFLIVFILGCSRSYSTPVEAALDCGLVEDKFLSGKYIAFTNNSFGTKKMLIKGRSAETYIRVAFHRSKWAFLHSCKFAGGKTIITKKTNSEVITRGYLIEELFLTVSDKDLAPFYNSGVEIKCFGTRDDTSFKFSKEELQGFKICAEKLLPKS